MKELVIWIVLSIMSFVLLPFFMVYMVTPDANLPMALFYLFLCCPIYFIITGYLTSLNFKKFWVFPILGLFAFMMTGSMILGMSMQEGIFYLVIYTVITIISVFLFRYFHKQNQEDE